jgi:hypothetical protein
MNKKLKIYEVLKVGGVQRGKKGEKMFCKLENLFLLLFFHYSFSFTFQRWFVKLEVALP